jgi:hypothetical protein
MVPSSWLAAALTATAIASLLVVRGVRPGSWNR